MRGSSNVRPSVLQLVGSFHVGGSERQAVQLTRLLAESGRYRVHVACLDGDGPLRDELARIGLGDVPEFPLTSFYDRNAARQAVRFRRLLIERRVDLVHTHDFYTNVFGIPAAALAGIRARIGSRRNTVGTSTPLQKRVERGALRLAHAVVTNAEAVKRQLASEGIRERKIVTVYNGLDTSRVVADASLTRRDALVRLGLRALEDRALVTIVANLRHPVKDHPTFLRAARRVHDAVPEAAFVLAGEGGLVESTRALAAELGLADAVHFVGACRQMAELLAASSVCVLSSTAEGFSNSILEYMAASRPVVATDVGGAREAITEGETGYLVRSGDDAAMADRIVALLRDPDLARAMGERGSRRVEREFSCAAQLERVEALYERTLARGRVPERRGGRALDDERT